MKNLFFLFAAIFLTTGICAQDLFSIPEVPVEKKHQNMLGQIDAMATVSINFAKTQGLTAADYGKYVGEQFKNSWNKEAGFEGFVKGVLYNTSCFLSDPGMEIITNTSEKVKIKSHLIGHRVKKYEPFYGITYKEYIEFYEAAMSTIGDHLGSKIEFSYDEEWLYTTITKKK